MKKILFNSRAFLGAVTEKLSDAACKTGKGIQDYMEDEENIRHISLVVYDLMPLSVKLGLRHEKFYQQFKLVFVGIRKQLFPQSKTQTIKPVTKSTTRRRTSTVKNNDVADVAKTTKVKKIENETSKKLPRKTSRRKEV